MQFGNVEHFRTDYVNFVVADFDNTYHAILGRLALNEFMVVPHYSYLVLKMPTEHGVLTLRGNVYTACNGTVQIIRAQVRKQSPKRSNSQT
jgi:hypothetical protein